jgi:hypothetical protein
MIFIMSDKILTINLTIKILNEFIDNYKDWTDKYLKNDTKDDIIHLLYKMKHKIDYILDEEKHLQDNLIDEGIVYQSISIFEIINGC